MSAATEASRAAIAAVWREESARVIGGLVRFCGDVDAAEDLAHEALVRALDRWPHTGIPEKPGAWLTTTAKRIAIDHARHREMAACKHSTIDEGCDEGVDEAAVDVDVKDDVLRLMLIACHPVLPKEARVALTLRWVAGLSTAEIARAFLTSEPTLAQRLVRAKRTLSEARVPFALPTGAARRERIPPLLDVIYLVFNEGYSASAGDDLLRPALCNEALRLARRTAALVGADLDSGAVDVDDAASAAEVWGLLALLELQSSRLAARVDENGDAIVLADQDRGRWDASLIARGTTALTCAQALAARGQSPLGPFALQAAIAACHARASSTATTDWPQIVALYDALVECTGSPVVELNRAVAVSMAEGAAAGLVLVDALAADPALADYPLLAAVRGDLLERVGRVDDAAAAFVDAAARSDNARERAHFLRRADLARRGRAPA